MTLVDAHTAAVAAGVRPATIRQWARRGHIEAKGRSGRAHLYDLAEIARHALDSDRE